MIPQTERAAVPARLWTALCHGWTWKMAWRDSRGQRRRLALYALSVALGVAALVGIQTLKASVQRGIDTQAKSLLGADLLVSSRRPISEQPFVQMADRIQATGNETAFSSMLSAHSGQHAKLVQVRAIEGGYPFFATVETDPPSAWARLPHETGFLVEASLLEELGVKLGDTLRLGALEAPILGTILKGVPRSNRFSGFAPEIFFRHADLASTGLATEGSLVYHHRTLVWKSEEAGEQALVDAQFRKLFPQNGVEFQTPENRRETLGESLNRVQEFLGITALVALVLGGIGVAGAMYTHIKRRIPTVAILLCLGCPTQAAFAVYIAEAAVLGTIGSGLGALLGAALHAAVVVFAGPSLPVIVAPWPAGAALLSSTGTGLVLSCGFALFPLLQIRNIPPGATLAQRPVPGRQSRWPETVLSLILTALVFGVALLNGASRWRALFLTLGLGVAFLTLAATARALMHFTRRVLRPEWPYLLRQGVSNLFRPQNQTLLFVVSLGLGIFLLLTVRHTSRLLTKQLDFDARGAGPNLYLVDVQPDQTPLVRGLLEDHGLPVIGDAPMVTMRIATVKGRPLSALEQNDKPAPAPAPDATAPRTDSQRVPRWVMEREYRSTYRATLTEDEKIVAGDWSAHQNAAAKSGNTSTAETPAPLSLEQQLARDLRVTIGDSIVLDVQGVPLEARVTSIRKVDWSRFNLNFFMVFPPGFLEDAPQFHLLATRIPKGASSGPIQRALLDKAPNVSSVDLNSVLANISALLQKAARVVQLLAGFTVLAATPVLLGALLNGREQRLKESVLLRTLGASERQVRMILIVEYAALGALSALAGGLLATGAHFALARWMFHADFTLDFAPLLLAFAASTGASILAGVFISMGVCSQPPLKLLRQ